MIDKILLESGAQLELNNPSLIPLSLVLAIAIFVPTNNVITSNVQGLEQGQVNATILFDSTNLGDKAYESSQIEIPVWANVSWTNDDLIAHSVTAIEGEFDSGLMRPDEVFKYTFDKAGGYDYYCMLHPSMIGRVLVR